MKLISIGLFLFLSLIQFPAFSSTDLLWYKQPASKWEEALPLGNGFLGAMVFGGVPQEHIQFNEETLWTGQPRSYAHPGASDHLNTIRTLLAEGKQKEAEQIAEQHFMSIPKRQMAYQAFGDLYIDFQNHQQPTSYRRELDLATGTVKINYTVNKVEYQRTAFASYPSNCLYYHITTSKKKQLNFTLQTDALHDYRKSTHSNNEISLHVKVKDGVLEGVAKVKINTDGKIIQENGFTHIKHATYATIILAASTNFLRYDAITKDPFLTTTQVLEKAPSFEKALADHLTDYQQLYNRFSIDLPLSAASQLPTDERLQQFELQGNDPNLLALYVKYARYLLIASSRKGSQPANLQGIWNHSLKPSWDSKWTVNINTQMNYWPAELTNLSECHDPLFTLVKEVAETGKEVAKEHYDASGWVLHHNTDLWRGAAPINAANHGIWPTGGAWLALHLWERYEFNADQNFLENEAYPLLKGAAQFFVDFLIKDSKTGWYISTPSHSPEHGGLVQGPTMDHQIIRQLFKSCIQASEILHIDTEFANQLKTLTKNIAPNQIGKYGQLQEWLEDKDDTTNLHRHVSHLWAVYPGNEINSTTPELLNAAKKSLRYRGDDGTGWSLAWKINLWARFGEGDHAYKLIQRLFTPVKTTNQRETAGSYPNLFDAHPPFQIDGNFGGASGILELLIQSHLDAIHILPALPNQLPQGNIRGIKARNGFEIDFVWENHSLTQIKVHSLAGLACKIKYQNKTVTFPTTKGGKYILSGNLDLQF